MRRCMILAVSVVVAAMVAQTLMAQPPDRPRDRPDRPAQRGGPGGPGGGRGFGGPGGMMGRPGMMPPIMVALDADKDGEISAEEIENAAAALKKLDKNDDGKLDRSELRPQFDGRPGDQVRPQRPGGDRTTAFADRLMGFDANKDGKVDSDELPQQMKRILDRVDTNKDGAIDQEEIKAMAERFGRGGGPGAGGPRPGGPRPEGERPQRPRRPQPPAPGGDE